MTRKEFIKLCGILGVVLPSQYSFNAPIRSDDIAQGFNGKVVIIGAGAGGLSTGYLLQQQGIDFEILEASAVHGGRMRINTTFADFPIPMGAEWLETGTNIFQEIVNNPSIAIHIETVADTQDRKFVNSSWYNFFEEYIVPSIQHKISYNTIVQSIDYSEAQTIIATPDRRYLADKVIISVPLKILQDGDINFTPSLPQSKLDAINSTNVWPGFKAFFEFSSKFYDDNFEFRIRPNSDGQKMFYNASHGQSTSRHILGLFVVGKPALDYISLSDIELKMHILNELDGIYANQATPSYLKHIAQNWNKEPFIKSGYIADNANWRTIKALGKPVANKLHFAGGAYTDGQDWVSVHTAALSAIKAVKELSH